LHCWRNSTEARERNAALGARVSPRLAGCLASFVDLFVRRSSEPTWKGFLALGSSSLVHPSQVSPPSGRRRTKCAGSERGRHRIQRRDRAGFAPASLLHVRRCTAPKLLSDHGLRAGRIGRSRSLSQAGCGSPYQSGGSSSVRACSCSQKTRQARPSLSAPPAARWVPPPPSSHSPWSVVSAATQG